MCVATLLAEATAPPTPQHRAVETYGWDTAFAIPIPDVNKAIVDHRSSPAGFSLDTGQFSVRGSFGDWQVTLGGSGRAVRLSLPLSQVELDYPGTHRTEKYASGEAIIEVQLHYIPHTGTMVADTGTLHDLVVKSTRSGSDPVVTVVALTLDPPAHTVSEAVISEALTEWATKHLSAFSHTFAVVNLNRIIDTGDFAFVNPNYTSYCFLGGPTLDDSVLGVLCMTGDRSGSHLTEQISPDAIPSGSPAGFLVSQTRALQDLIRPAIMGAYPGLTASNFLLNSEGNELYLTENTKVALKPVEHNGTDYTPELTQLRVASNGEIITLTSLTSTSVAAGITATCQSTHWYRVGLGSSKHGQTLTFEEAQKPVIIHNIVRSGGSKISTLIIEIVAAIAILILGVLTDGAAFIVGGLVIGLLAGAAAIVPPLIEKVNRDDSPSIDALTVNAVDPIVWSGSKQFRLLSAAMNASLQLGGNPTFT